MSLRDLALTAVRGCSTALAPVRRALAVPEGKSDSDIARREARMARLLAMDITPYERARAINALDAVDAGLIALKAVLAPGSLPSAPGEDAQPRVRALVSAGDTAAARGAL